MNTITENILTRLDDLLLETEEETRKMSGASLVLLRARRDLINIQKIRRGEHGEGNVKDLKPGGDTQARIKSAYGRAIRALPVVPGAQQARTTTKYNPKTGETSSNNPRITRTMLRLSRYSGR